MTRRRSKAQRRAALRRRILLAGWLLGAALILARAVALQVLERTEWRGMAEKQHRTTVEVPAPRGSVLDRDGVPIAVSHERFRVSVAPPELRDREEVAQALIDALGVSAQEAARVTRSSKRWVVVAGHYPPSVEDELDRVTGVYLQRALPRYYPHGDQARAVLGSVTTN